MSWNARLKAALRGDVSGADVAALPAASAPLASLSQEMADRRLAAEIDHAGHEWRVCTTLAPIAAPLWLGEALVTLAQSLAEAEAESHPDRPSDLSPAAHALAATVLQPVESIIAEVSAALVDPARPSGLTAPLTVGPGGVIAAYALPDPVPMAYARGVLRAARRIHGAAQAALDDTASLVGRSPAPGWLTAGLQRVAGELRATAVRLDMAETRLAAALRAPHPDQELLANLCNDAWDVLNAALMSGQMLRAPHLLPGAPPAAVGTGQGAGPAPPAAGTPRPAPVQPAPSAATTGVAFPSAPPAPVREPERPCALPEIGEGGRGAAVPSERESARRAGDAGQPHGQPSEPPALPQIGDADPGARPTAPYTPPPQAAPDGDGTEPPPFELPQIGPVT